MIEEKTKIKKFLSDSSSLIGGCVLTAIAVIMIIVFLISEVVFMTILSFIVAIVGIFIIWSSIKSKKRLNIWFDEIEATGQLPYVVQDFNNAQIFFKNNLRMGSSYIFGKDSEEVFLYKDIERAWQYIHKTNGSEDSRSLQIKTTDGKVYNICSIPTKGKGDVELNMALGLIMLHNPEVKIGYQ